MAITVYTYNDKVLKNTITDKWLKKYVNPYNPLGLPAKTIRIRTSNDVELTPSETPGSFGGATVKQVVSTNVYDIEFTYNAQGVLNNQVGGSKVLEILGFNTEGMTTLANVFNGCSALTTIPLLDYTNITSVDSMFSECTSLITVPGFNLPSATTLQGTFYGCTGLTSMPNITLGQSSLLSVSNMFDGCTEIASGILDMYAMLSSKTYTGQNYSEDCFANCGSNTVTGAAELAQIPTSWGGTATYT